MLVKFSDPQAMWERATTRARELLEVMYDRMGFDDAKRVEAIAIGIYAELAFKTQLKKLKIPHEYSGDDAAAEGADEFDFLIGDRKFDIKCAKTERQVAPHWEYGYPVDQNPQRKDFIVVSNYHPLSKEVLFFGYISGQDVVRFPKKKANQAGVGYSTLNYNFPYSALNQDIETLLKSL